MNEQTDLLALPYILPSQAQKHVIHNEALRILDALIQLRLTALDCDTPSDSPSEGARYGVGSAPEGAFSGHSGQVAAFQDGAWAFFVPAEGWLAWDTDGGRPVVFDGSAWIAVFDPQGLPLLGVNATADETNRLTVAADAVLFTHAGGDHRIKVNKAAAEDTATLLFQSGWSGRAEMGLAGNDDFSLKVSPDGATWQTALRIDRATGRIGIGTDTPATALDVAGTVRSATGFRIGDAVLQKGSNAYQLNTSSHFSTTGLFAVGTTPINNTYLRVRVPDATPERRAIYAYSHVTSSTDGNPLFVVLGDGRTGIGTMLPSASAALDVVSTARGFLPPRLTEAQRDANASPDEGLVIYNTSAHKPQFWNGSTWVDMG